MRAYSRNLSAVKGRKHSYINKILNLYLPTLFFKSLFNQQFLKKIYRKQFIFLLVWAGSFSFLNVSAVKTETAPVLAASSPFLLVFDGFLKRHARGNAVIEILSNKFVRQLTGIAPVRSFCAWYRFNIAPFRKITARARSDPVPVSI